MREPKFAFEFARATLCAKDYAVPKCAGMALNCLQHAPIERFLIERGQRASIGNGRQHGKRTGAGRGGWIAWRGITDINKGLDRDASGIKFGVRFPRIGRQVHTVMRQVDIAFQPEIVHDRRVSVARSGTL